MKPNGWMGCCALGVAGVLMAGSAVAQGTLQIELLDRGKPIPSVPVSVVGLSDLLNSGKPVGTTGADGKTTVNVASAGFPIGSRVEVWVRTCSDGTTRIVLAPDGTTSRCGDEADRCQCQRLGAFVWGAGRLTVDVGTRTVTHSPTASPAAGTVAGGGARHSLIAGVGMSYFPNLENAVSGQTGLSSADVGPLGRTLYLGYEFQPAGSSPFTFGLGASCTRFSRFDQVYSPTPGGPSRSSLDFGVLTAGAQVGIHPLSAGPLDLYGGLDFLMAFNRLDLETEYPGLSDPVTGSRSESGLRIAGRVGADVSLSGRAGLRATVGYTWGKGKDADNNLSFGLGLRYNLAGRIAP